MTTHVSKEGCSKRQWRTCFGLAVVGVAVVVLAGCGAGPPAPPEFADLGISSFWDAGTFPGYIGCYADEDQANRVLPERQWQVGDATAETCNAACVEGGYTYFGLQYYGECYCGNGPNLGEKKGENECFFPCNGDPNVICGAGGRNSIYRADASATTGCSSCGCLDAQRNPRLCVTAGVSAGSSVTANLYMRRPDGMESLIGTSSLPAGDNVATFMVYEDDMASQDGVFNLSVGTSSSETPLTGLFTKVGNFESAVQCPGSSTYCEASMCCPGTEATGGLTFPCPTAIFAEMMCEAGQEAVLSALMVAMSREEKLRFLKGTGWFGQARPLKRYFIGNAGHRQRFGIPTVNMQDSGNGFRNDVTIEHSNDKYSEQVTSFPVALAIASIWSTEDFGRYGSALGREFRKKGANMLLGPAVNVHRVPRCGRNAEYLSGESPYLGARLTKPYIRGVQSQKVLASVKHFINNNQESCRHSSDSISDDRTRWELYYPPFQAAVEADVAAQMCGYNLVNGEKNCQNRDIMQTDLKDRMGFKGWVQSDWWALNNFDSAINAGIDQEMPGHAGAGFDYFFKDENLAGLSIEQVDHMLRPQLEKMLQYGLFEVVEDETCSFGGGCDSLLYDNTVTSPENEALSRELATKAVTLLKNEPFSGDATKVLPLNSSISKIALLGAACHQLVDPDYMLQSWVHRSYYFIGGSGRVIGRDPTTVYQGLLEKCPGYDIGYQGCFRDDIDDRKLPFQAMSTGATISTCRDACSSYTYFGLQYYKECFCGNPTDLGERALEGECGTPCDAEPGTMCGGGGRNSIYTVAVPPDQNPSCEIVTEFTDDHAAAIAKAADADVAIVCGGVTSTEGEDRSDLSVVEEDFMVNVAQGITTIPVVALTLTPGTIMMPWIDQVSAAMNLFLPGKYGGTAFADVLFGDATPSAKTPIAYPKDIASTIPPCPCGEVAGDPCVYEEGLFIGWYNMSADQILFPFGHGLSYTTFAYSNIIVETSPVLVAAECPDQDADLGAAIVCVTAVVQNSGSVNGVEVAQLYMGFPEAANEPPMLLRGFNRLPELAPGAEATARFPLYSRDMQIYSMSSNGWVNQDGVFQLYVGTSSADTPLTGSFTMTAGAAGPMTYVV